MEYCTGADPEGVRWVRTNPPSALGYYELVQQLATEFTYRSNDDRLNGTPLSGYRTKKTAAMAHLSMLQ